MVTSDDANAASAHWQLEYDFWTKIITDETARLRWNEGFEPLDCDMYLLQEHTRRTWWGRSRVCGRDFVWLGVEATDMEGKHTLKLSIRAKKR